MVLIGWLRRRWLQVLVHIGALLPLVFLLRDYAQGSFIIDPVKEITTTTGRAALVLLLLSLACTPINTIFGLRRVLRVRRALGLYAFMYAALHFMTFVGLDYAFDFGLLGPAIFDQRFVIVGFAAFLLLLALALTSTRGWQKRLGRKWKRLHMLVYLAGGLVIVHFLWAVKDGREPLRYGILLVLLLAVRVPWVRRTVSNARHKLKRHTRALVQANRSIL
jgi:sulfoxide reductase heme-binding subunit YedZ